MNNTRPVIPQVILEINSIIQKSIDGNQIAVKRLYDTYANEMYSTSLRITNDKQGTEDIIQESFLKSISQLKTLTNTNNYQGWYRRIVINASLKFIKKKVSFVDVDDQNYKSDDDHQNWYMGISMALIRDAIQQLPDRSRTIFTLYALEDYKHKDIADELGISISTSKTQYRYARKLLKSHLTKVHAL